MVQEGKVYSLLHIVKDLCINSWFNSTLNFNAGNYILKFKFKIQLHILHLT